MCIRDSVYTLTNVPGWNNVPVRDMLQAACGLPVYCLLYTSSKSAQALRRNFKRIQLSSD